jgi:phosphopantetheine--protein transferase-like protein
MILSLGTDIVSVARIRAAMEREGFVSRILTQAETRLAMDAQFLAGRWAAKEAIKKCCPWLDSWHDVVIDSSDGPPQATVRGLTEGETVMVSISHEREYAVATAIRCKLS